VLIAADLFCGAGGTTCGAEQSGAAQVRFAVNHWDVAIQTHSANHPHTVHANRRLDQVHPGEAPRMDLLFASPECIHHSRARGGRPTSDQQRSGAWEVLRWVDHHRPSWIVIENVKEFREWGPVDPATGRPLVSGKGKTFDAWREAIKSYGYRVECFDLNAADYGAATSRDRLFVIARKGRRGVPCPEPTHTRTVRGPSLPGMGLQPWRGAWEIIDWSIPFPSIFSRSRDLADKTLLRLEAGLRKFVEPMVIRFRQHGTGESVGDPLGTITAGGNHHGLAVPFISKQFGMKGATLHGAEVGGPLGTVTTIDHHAFIVPFLGERPGQAPRCHSACDPVPSVTTSNPKGIAVPYIVRAAHGAGSWGHAPASPEKPLGVMTSKRDFSIAVPFLTQFYGSGGQWSGAGSPLPVITTADRHAIALATIDPLCLDWPEPTTEAMAKLQSTMRELGVADLGFRMAWNHELSAAQAFPSSYIFRGNKSQVTKQIGNSVSPVVAKAITEAIAAA
jgi:DNA (cytosine-5)-methyltransferase 1